MILLAIQNSGGSIRKGIGILMMLLLLCPILVAQEEEKPKEEDKYLKVYPIRENHKWGYNAIYKVNGHYHFYEVIPPKYDLLSDDYIPWNTLSANKTPSPYRLFEKDGRVGLLNKRLEEVVPNKYKRIKPLTDIYYAVEVDSLFTLLKREGEEYTVMWPGQSYHNIVFAESYDAKRKPYFLIKQDEKWGIANEDGEVVVTPKFKALRYAGYPGHFMVQKIEEEKKKNKQNWYSQPKKKKKEAGWGLLRPLDEVILDYKYRDIVVFDENTFAAMPMDTVIAKEWFFFVLEQDGFKQAKLDVKTLGHLNVMEGFLPQPIVNKNYYYEKCDEFIKLAGNLVLLKTEALDPVIYDVQKDERVNTGSSYKRESAGNTKNKPLLIPISKNYIVAKYPAGGLAVLDTSLQVVIPRGKYSKIWNSGLPAIFLAKNKAGKWGIIGPSKDSNYVKVKFKFDAIRPFNGKEITLCHVEKKNDNEVSGYGAVSYKNGIFQEISCQYDTIYIGESMVTVSQDEGENNIRWKLNEDGTFEMMEEFDDVVVVDVAKFEGNKEAKGDIIKPFRINTMPKYTAALEANNFIASRKDNEFRVLSKRAPYNTEIYVGVLGLWNNLAALYSYNEVSTTGFSEEVFRGRLSTAQLYNIALDKPLDIEPILGLRRTSNAHKYTTFIDKYGGMGLIDREGKQKKGKNGQPVRYTYIGPFQNGYARVCKGGSLQQKQDKDFELGGIGVIKISTLHHFITDFNLKAPSKTQRSYLELGDIGIYALPIGEDIPVWGFINKNGDEVVSPSYDFVSDFSESEKVAYIVSIREDTLQQKNVKSLERIYYGLLDKNCKVIIQPDYKGIGVYGDYYVLEKNATPVFFYDNKGRQVLVNRTKPRAFSEGYASFKNEDGLWGFIDTLGTVIAPPAFKKVRNFSDGMAAVVLPSDQCAYINTKGDIAFVTDLLSDNFKNGLGDFSAGRCPIRKGKKWGYMDKQGRVFIPCQYLKAYNFVRGVATIEDFINGKRQYAVIDSNATNFVVKPGVYNLIKPFNQQGIAMVQNREKKWGIIDVNGKEIVTPQFESIRDDEFINGYNRVLDQNKMWGLINQSGKLVVEPKYAVIDTVSEGIVALKETPYEKYRIYDITNKRFLKGEYDEVEEFRNGVSLVREENALKVINRNGKDVELKEKKPLFYSEGLLGMADEEFEYYSDPYGDNMFINTYSEVKPHKNGIAKIQVGRKAFMALNNRGIIVVPAKYSGLYVDKNGFVKANPNRYYGLVDKKGRPVVPPEYDRIIAFKDKSGSYNGLFRVEEGEKVGYLRMKEEGGFYVLHELDN